MGKAEENAEVVRRGYAAFNAADMNALTEIFHVSASWHTAERNGKRLDVGCCIVFEVKDGQIVDGREHFFDVHAWDEFWS